MISVIAATVLASEKTDSGGPSLIGLPAVEDEYTLSFGIFLGAEDSRHSGYGVG